MQTSIAKHNEKDVWLPRAEKKVKNGNKGGTTIIWTTLIIQIQRGRVIRKGPGDSGKLRALGTLWPNKSPHQ